MKRKRVLLIAVVLFLSAIVLFSFFGRKNNNVSNNQNQTASGAQQNASVQASAPDQFTTQFSIVKGDERPIAVMIDNEAPAIKRHTGLDKAYAIYEAVVESGDTRMMALFKGVNVEKIGPVRSSRHYFIHYAMEHDSVYVHFGWSPLAEETMSKLKVNNINGIKGIDGAIFWRDPSPIRHDYHNAFTNTEKIKKMMNRKKYRETSSVNVFKYSSTDLELTNGVKAEDINIGYSGYRKIGYKYDAGTKLYKRFTSDKPHIDALSKVQYTSKNIIIEFVNSYHLNDGTKADRKQVDTVGQGKGYFITNGKEIEITWKKSSPTAITEYKDINGNEILLNNGQTWIQIVPAKGKVSIQ